jgi:hypothetical protein
MPLDPLKKITFNEGEPLDPNKLNELQANASTAYTASYAVYNSTTNTQSNPIVPVIKSGQLQFGKMAAKEIKTISLPSDIRTEGLPAPQVVASFRNKGEKDQIVTVSVHEITTNPSVTVYTSTAISNCLVDWIAVTYKEISTS